MKKILFIFAFGLAIISCEKVINIDLNDANTQLVVEGIVTDSLGSNFIKLTKTGSYYESNTFEKVNNAQVSLNSSDGNVYPFDFISEGIYTNPSFKGEVGTEYTLSIEHEGELFQSFSKIPTKVYIDSLSCEAISFGPPTIKNPYVLRVHLVDPANEKNYYRFRLFVNDTLSKQFLYTNDKFFDGIKTEIGLGLVEKNDKVFLEMYCIDESNYNYFNTIDDASSTDSPGNPISNIEGENVIGYFGAYTIDSKSLIVK